MRPALRPAPCFDGRSRRSEASLIARSVAAIALVGEAGVWLLVHDRRQAGMGGDRRVDEGLVAVAALNRRGRSPLVMSRGESRGESACRNEAREGEFEE